MAYIGFDLDETLGRFVVPYYHLLFLQPHTSLYKEIWSGLYGTERRREPIPLSSSLRTKLDTAFEMFVDCIAEENQETLGLLRPGILEIARRLHELKTTSPPQVRAVVIYSNNGNIASLRLAAKLIEKLASAPGLFCNLVHWFHPSREDEVEYGNPGSATKTLQTLMNIFQEGGCPRGEVDVENIYFFDDKRHEDIADVIGPRYFLVPAYKVDADPTIFDRCFVKAFETAGLANDPEYWAYIRPLQIKTLREIMNYLDRGQVKTFKKERVNNTSFRRRFNTTFPAPPVSRNVFQKSLQTMRKLEQKQNTGKNLSANEQRLLNQSKNIITQYEAQNPSTGGSRKTKKQRRRH
jgi:hypothetical protein